MTTNQKYEVVVAGMVVFWIAFAYFVSRQPGPRVWWKPQPVSKDRKALDELRRLNKR